MTSPPNIILLTIDTLRADRLGCYGFERPITPNIDRLAAAGIRFENAITGGSWTQAAFPVILTSTYASMYGGCLGPLSPARPSPIEALANNGYRTGGFTTSPLLSKTYGYDRGFTHFEELDPGESESFLKRMKGGQKLLRRPATHAVASRLGLTTRPSRTYASAAELLGRARAWIEGAQSPFFAWAHLMDVHWPYHREELLRDAGEIAQAWRDLGHMHRANWRGERVDDDQRRHYLQLYENAVVYTDAQIGSFLAYLESSGRMDDTVVLIVSDHGEEFFERRHWGHFEANLYDEIVRVPFILYLPDHLRASFPAGRAIQRQVRLLDIMPTVMELSETPGPPGLEGESLTPLWNGHQEAYAAGYAISEKWRPEWQIVAVRTNEFKYIWDSKHPDRPELYDLIGDPAELINLIDAHPRQARRSEQIVKAHLERFAAESPQELAAEPELDEKLMRRLRSLGYVE